MTPKHFYCEIYKTDIYYFLGWNPGRFTNYCIKNYGYDPGEQSEGLCAHVRDNIIIWTKHRKRFELLAHESVHAAHWILESRGICSINDNAEPLAYLVELIFKNGS